MSNFQVTPEVLQDLWSQQSFKAFPVTFIEHLMNCNTISMSCFASEAF